MPTPVCGSSGQLSTADLGQQPTIISPEKPSSAGRFPVLLGEQRPGLPTTKAEPELAGAGPLCCAGPDPSATSPRALDSPVTSTLSSVLGGLIKDEQSVNRGLSLAMTGRTFSPQELIALQARVMQYSQVLQISSQLLDKATGAVKQVVSTQV
ncbi:MAG: hypothetical protein V2A73_17090 [Pseudomonadota bacterium]